MFTVLGAGPDARNSFRPRTMPAALTICTVSSAPAVRRWWSITGSWRFPSGLWTTVHPVTLTPVERALLRVMAIMVHDRAHATAELGIITREPPKVTPREQECMNWVAAGKTDAEIGIILGISAATAHFHIEHVKKKLGTRSRTEAVGLLVLAGMI